jgi:hypothetical protein
MNGRRLLGETLSEIAGSALDMPGTAVQSVHVTSIKFDLPIDIRLAREDDVVLLIGDVPLMRTRTDFDPLPARLQITCVASPLEATT